MCACVGVCVCVCVRFNEKNEHLPAGTFVLPEVHDVCVSERECVCQQQYGRVKFLRTKTITTKHKPQIQPVRQFVDR